MFARHGEHHPLSYFRQWPRRTLEDTIGDIFVRHIEDNAYGTRLTGLEADAYAAYYLSHPRGERLRNRRVEQFVRTYFEIGDCSFESDGHHGTPDQREDAARWAYELANAKGAKGHVLPAAEVSAQFRQVLPEIVAPDA